MQNLFFFSEYIRKNLESLYSQYATNKTTMAFTNPDQQNNLSVE